MLFDHAELSHVKCGAEPSNVRACVWELCAWTIADVFVFNLQKFWSSLAHSTYLLFHPISCFVAEKAEKEIRYVVPSPPKSVGDIAAKCVCAFLGEKFQDPDGERSMAIRKSVEKNIRCAFRGRTVWGSDRSYLLLVGERGQTSGNTTNADRGEFHAVSVCLTARVVFRSCRMEPAVASAVSEIPASPSHHQPQLPPLLKPTDVIANEATIVTELKSPDSATSRALRDAAIESCQYRLAQFDRCRAVREVRSSSPRLPLYGKPSLCTCYVILVILIFAHIRARVDSH